MIEAAIRGEVEVDVPMSRHTTLRVGGMADIVVSPQDVKALESVVVLAHEKKIPLAILGLGSNILVKDGGIRGIVIDLTKGLKGLKEKEGNRLYCEAGVSLGAVVSKAADAGLGGMEFLAGIPGTVGGAVRMNAGAFGREIKEIIDCVTIMDNEGKMSSFGKDELDFSYRNLDLGEGATIVDCTFALKPMDKDEIRERMKSLTLERSKKQPLIWPTAGSVFKNPPGSYAGQLIEEAGLKGMIVGDARVSEKHANFIENMGKATATDVLALIELIRDRVYRKKGIMLDLEVKVVGEGAKSPVRVLD